MIADFHPSFVLILAHCCWQPHGAGRGRLFSCFFLSLGC